MFQGETLVVIWGYPDPIVLNLDGVKTLILESDIYNLGQIWQESTRGSVVFIPILVASASRLFSTNSLTTEHKSTMT